MLVDLKNGAIVSLSYAHLNLDWKSWEVQDMVPEFLGLGNFLVYYSAGSEMSFQQRNPKQEQLNTKVHDKQTHITGLELFNQ